MTTEKYPVIQSALSVYRSTVNMCVCRQRWQRVPRLQPNSTTSILLDNLHRRTSRRPGLLKVDLTEFSPEPAMVMMMMMIIISTVMLKVLQVKHRQRAHTEIFEGQPAILTVVLHASASGAASARTAAVPSVAARLLRTLPSAARSHFRP